MKFSKRFTPVILTLCLALTLASCGTKSSSDGKIPNSSTNSSEDTSNKSSDSTNQSAASKDGSPSNGSQVNGDQDMAKEEYPHDVAKHRKTFPKKGVDLVFKDKNYVSLINDCFINPKDYVGKTVEIEGFYIWDGLRTYVGRKGPVCPYCTAGYVGIEYHGDEKSVINAPPEGANTTPPDGVFVPEKKNPDPKYDRFVIGDTWIKVKGYVRQGNDPTAGAFTYIEAISVEVMSEKGTETVK